MSGERKGDVELKIREKKETEQDECKTKRENFEVRIKAIEKKKKGKEIHEMRMVTIMTVMMMMMIMMITIGIAILQRVLSPCCKSRVVCIHMKQELNIFS